MEEQFSNQCDIVNQMKVYKRWGCVTFKKKDWERQRRHLGKHFFWKLWHIQSDTGDIPFALWGKIGKVAIAYSVLQSI